MLTQTSTRNDAQSKETHVKAKARNAARYSRSGLHRSLSPALLALSNRPQGDLVNHTAHRAPKPSTPNGFLAQLRAFLRRAPGSGSPSVARRCAIALCALFATACAFALSAAPALAAQTHLFEISFNGSGEAPHALESPEGLAVDNSAGATKGDVYVADVGHAVIDVFESSGKYLSQINGSETVQKSFSPSFSWSLAVDPTEGDLYVADAGHNAVDKFDNSGKVVSGFGTKGQISTENIEEGQLGSKSAGNSFQPTGIAVDPKTGDLYVDDTNNAVIDVFESSGKYLRQFASNLPSYEDGSMAIDSQGNLFLANYFGTDVYVAATGKLNTSYGGGTGLLDSGHSFAVAVDPNNDDVYVDHPYEPETNVAQYDNTGKLLDSFGSGHVGVDYGGVAVGKANSHVYVSNFQSSAVEIFGTQTTVAEATTEAAAEVTATTATLKGTVNPAGLELKECFFEYGETKAYGHKASCEETPAQIGEGEAPVKVQAKITIEPGTSYHFRLLAPNANGPAVGSADQPLGIPIVEADTVHEINAKEEITVFGTVSNPSGETSYHFEFVTEEQFENEAFAKATSTKVETGGGFVSAKLPNLQPETGYRFRLAAEGSDAPGDLQYSPVKSIPKPHPLEPAPETCPNEVDRYGAWRPPPRLSRLRAGHPRRKGRLPGDLQLRLLYGDYVDRHPTANTF